MFISIPVLWLVFSGKRKKEYWILLYWSPQDLHWLSTRLLSVSCGKDTTQINISFISNDCYAALFPLSCHLNDSWNGKCWTALKSCSVGHWLKYLYKKFDILTRLEPVYFYVIVYFFQKIFWFRKGFMSLHFVWSFKLRRRSSTSPNIFCPSVSNNQVEF